MQRFVYTQTWKCEFKSLICTKTRSYIYLTHLPISLVAFVIAPIFFFAIKLLVIVLGPLSFAAILSRKRPVV